MQRFVSYLYSIYNNQKIHNAGFARIELRTGRNRVDIHLRENGYAGKTGTVYLFIRKQKNIQGISIGNITFRNNQADFRYEQPEENIGQTPWKILQMHGILIMIDDRAAFLSQWDEQPVDTEQFEVWNIDKLEENQKEENSGQKKSNQGGEDLKELNQDGSNQKKSNQKDLNQKELNQKESNQKKSEQESMQKKEYTQLASGNTRQKTFSETTAEEKMTSAIHQNETSESDLAEQEKTPDRDQKREHREADAENAAADNSVQRETVNTVPDNSNQSNSKQPDSDQTINNNQSKNAEESSDIHTAELQPQRVNQWEQNWRYMLRMYPVLNQFTDKNNVLCVRIEIKDVRLLPEKYWSMINNSFLLHGFFNYRHLIFGRIEQNWFIGIPGIYQNQEHVMASIFGFPDFLPQTQKNERGEQPGYWYRILDI